MEEIGPHDVLLGRGAPISENEGNARLRRIVVRRHSDYIAATDRNTKHRVAIEIVDTVLQKGGRFLQKATGVKTDNFDGPWEVVPNTPNDIIMRKVKQLLRDMGPEARERRAERKRLARKNPCTSTKPAKPLDPSGSSVEDRKIASTSVEEPTVPRSNTRSQMQAETRMAAFSLPPFTSSESALRVLMDNLTSDPYQSTTLPSGEREPLLSLLASTLLPSQEQQIQSLIRGSTSLGNVAHLIRQHQQQQSVQQRQHLAALLQETAFRQLQPSQSSTQQYQSRAQEQIGVNPQILRLLLQQNHVDPQVLQSISLLTPTTRTTATMNPSSMATLSGDSDFFGMHRAETFEQHNLSRALRGHLAFRTAASVPPHFQQQSMTIASQREHDHRREGQCRQVNNESSSNSS